MRSRRKPWLSSGWQWRWRSVSMVWNGIPRWKNWSIWSLLHLCRRLKWIGFISNVKTESISSRVSCLNLDFSHWHQTIIAYFRTLKKSLTCCGELISGLSRLRLGGSGGGGGGGVGGSLGLIGSPNGRWGPGDAGLWGPGLFDPPIELWLAWLYLGGLNEK